MPAPAATAVPDTATPGVGFLLECLVLDPDADRTAELTAALLFVRAELELVDDGELAAFAGMFDAVLDASRAWRGMSFRRASGAAPLNPTTAATPGHRRPACLASG